MKGWISLHRKIVDHWVFSDAERLRAWLIILIDVNHSEKKKIFGDKILVCKRGESLNSLDTWTLKFGSNWNKSKTRRFLKMLENDTMIVLKSERITTRLTVCNYEDYQGERNADETQVKRKRNASETQVTPNNNVNNENNDNNDNNEDSKFKKFYEDDYLNTVKETVKQRNINLTLEQIKEQASIFVNERLCSTDTNKSFFEYADHFRNILIRKHKNGELGSSDKTNPDDVTDEDLKRIFG